MTKAAELIIRTYKNGNKILLCGNSGNVADISILIAVFNDCGLIEQKLFI